MSEVGGRRLDVTLWYASELAESATPASQSCQFQTGIHLIHGLNEPLSVWGEALCQFTQSLDDISFLDPVAGASEVVNHLLDNDLPRHAVIRAESECCRHDVGA